MPRVPSNATGSDINGAGGPRCWLTTIGWGFVFLGIALRLRRFAAGHSLWLDEILLALNVEKRSLFELMEPLEFSQVSPFGFVGLTKLFTVVLGVNEYSLRLVAFAAGVAALPAFYVLVRRLAGAWGALVGVALFAVSRELVLYSAEFKHYEVEALASVVLLWLAVRVVEQPSRTGWFTLAAAGVMTVWFTFAGVFVLVVVGLVLLWASWRRGGARAAWPAVVCGLVWGVAFLPVLVVQVTRDAGAEELHDYWRFAFMPMPPRSASDAEWFVKAWHGLFDATVGGAQAITGDRVGLLLGPFFVLGLVLAWRMRREWAVLLTGPIVLALGASAVHAYPFSGRLILFLAPGVIVCVAIAAGAVLQGLAERSRGAAVTFVVAVLALPIAEGLGRLVQAPAKEDWKGVMTEIAASAQPGDAVYLIDVSGPAWDYYGPRLGLTGAELVRPVLDRDENVDREATVEALRRHRRVWVLGRSSAPGRGGERHAWLARVGERRLTFQGGAAVAYLYEPE